MKRFDPPYPTAQADVMGPPGVESVDLKWSLWVSDADALVEYAPGLPAKLAAAFEGGKPLRVQTAPRKEIRYGSVRVEEGKAHVDFVAVWDEPRDLLSDALSMDDLALDRLTDWFINSEGFYDEDSPIGARVTKTVEAKSFPALMAAIDACEAELLTQEKVNGARLDAFIQEMEKA